MAEKLTPEEIKKALECCYKQGGSCKDCPLDEQFEDCNDVLMARYVIDLINRQQAEIEQLKKDKDGLAVALANAVGRNVGLKEDIERLQNDLAISRKETKRYATRRRKHTKNELKRIKEMVGEDK